MGIYLLIINNQINNQVFSQITDQHWYKKNPPKSIKIASLK
jgi:hypothetical protein